jgi:CheY-like chemotaxis protein
MFRVLVIDDNPAVRELLQRILEGAGYPVDLASDGALGLILQRARESLIVRKSARAGSGTMCR